VKQKPPRLEAIRWLDHSSFADAGWKPIEHIVATLAPMVMTSVGYSIHETPEFVTLVSSVSGDGVCASGDTCIMKSAILKRWRLADPEKRRR
jgi:hypothetical protein